MSTPHIRLAPWAALLLCIVAPAPSGAQSTGFVRPATWRLRGDLSGADTTGVSFVDMPPGWQISTGSAVILWDPTEQAQGTFRVEMEVYLFDPAGGREPFGFFVGGRNLGVDQVAYTSFLIREGGEYMIERRVGDASRTLVPWTPDRAILSFSEKPEDQSTAKNVLTLEAEGDEVRFSVNGRSLTTMRRTPVALDGTVGLKVGAHLTLHVSRLDVTPARRAGPPDGPPPVNGTIATASRPSAR